VKQEKAPLNLNDTQLFSSPAEIEKLHRTKQEESFAKLSAITASTHIYVVGHCSVKGDKLHNDSDASWDYTQFADLLAQKAPQIKFAKQPITITLIACFTGIGGEESFAAKLSKALAERGIWSRIYAAMGQTSRFNNEGTYQPLIDGKYHADRSMVLVESKAGKTTLDPVIYSDPKFSLDSSQSNCH